MKKIYSLITIIALLSISSKLKANDILVEEFGIAPAYPSITTAVAAAVDGDRIIIKNRAGNIPWIENITIDKSLEFLSYDNDSMFIVQGTYTIVLAAGRTVTIIGMSNLSGSVAYSGSASIKSTVVNIFDCSFTIGNINLGSSGVKLNLAATTLTEGNVSFVYGNIIGNDLSFSGSAGTINCSNSATYQSDTVNITGNKVTNNNTGYYGLYIETSGSICYIKNNFVRHKTYGIYFTYSANFALASYIYNNTLVAIAGSSTPTGIYIYGTPSSGIVEIMNNVIDDSYPGTSYGIYGSNLSGQVNVYYNHISNSVIVPINGSFTFTGNNQTNVPIVLATDGTITSGTPINGGNPAAPFYDLDLTAGDAGAYGGSFTLNNFFPLHVGPARVYFVNYPFNVRQGSTLNVKANSYDR